MREIKFRLWEKGCNSLNDVNYFTIPITDSACVKSTITFYQGDRIDQYTGLKDKTGVEIYEGDIVTYKQASGGLLPPGDSHTCVIQWEGFGWSCINVESYTKRSEIFGRYNIASSHLKVIGNIYENPELLND